MRSPDSEPRFTEQKGSFANLADVQAYIETLDTENSEIGARLLKVWEFFPKILERYGIKVPVKRHAELGTYNGYQLPPIAEMLAEEIDAVDSDLAQNAIAFNRPEVLDLINQGRVRLYFGDATDLRGILPSGFADTVSAVEIFGARKDQIGGEETIMGVSGEAYRMLKPGGFFLFTVLNEQFSAHTSEESFGSKPPRGIVTSQENMDSMMQYIFHQPVLWAGQNIHTLNRELDRWVSPRGFSPNEPVSDSSAWTPRFIKNFQTQCPQYWIGAVQKPE